MDKRFSLLLIFFIVFSIFSTSSYAYPQPFSLIETRTDYGISKNYLYVETTDLLDKDQNIVNFTLDFVDSEKTRTIEIIDFMLYQSYEQDIFGTVNESQGKYTTTDQICEIVNETETCINYYYDDSEELLECNHILEDKTCLKEVKGITGQETLYDYLTVPNTKEKIIIDGLKIEQKVEGSIPLPKGGTVQIKIPMKHLLFYGVDVTDEENKFNATMCSQYGCVVLDPEWWNLNYPYRYKIIANTTDVIPLSVNGTYGIKDSNYWVLQNNDSYVYSETADYGGAIVIANETDEKCWYNTTSSSPECANVWGVNASLVAHFDNSVTSDFSDNNNTIVLVNSPVYNATGKIGGAYTFDGSSMSMNINSSGSSNIVGNQITLMAWVNVPSFADREIIWKWYSGGAGRGYVLRVFTNGVFSLGAVSDSICDSASSSVPANTWTHVAGVYDGSNLNLYLNGAYLSQCAKSGNIPTMSEVMSIGVATNPGTAYYFLGSIDEPRVYDRALSATEVMNEYYNGINNLTRMGDEEVNISVSIPTWSNPSNYTPSVYDSADASEFNITMENTPTEVYIEINITGSFVNYSMSNTYGGDIWNFTRVLGSGIYNYSFYGNNSGGQNQSDKYTAGEIEDVTLVIEQWVQVQNYSDYWIEYNLTVWIFNNDTTTVYCNVTPSSNYTSPYVVSVNTGISNHTIFTSNYTRPATDTNFTISAASLSLNCTASSDALFIIIPIDPPSAASKGAQAEEFRINDSVASTLSASSDESVSLIIIDNVFTTFLQAVRYFWSFLISGTQSTTLYVTGNPFVSSILQFASDTSASVLHDVMRSLKIEDSVSNEQVVVFDGISRSLLFDGVATTDGTVAYNKYQSLLFEEKITTTSSQQDVENRNLLFTNSVSSSLLQTFDGYISCSLWHDCEPDETTISGGGSSGVRYCPYNTTVDPSNNTHLCIWSVRGCDWACEERQQLTLWNLNFGEVSIFKLIKDFWGVVQFVGMEEPTSYAYVKLSRGGFGVSWLGLIVLVATFVGSYVVATKLTENNDKWKNKKYWKLSIPFIVSVVSVILLFIFI